jgi:asparagine synthase (glutamine-hydrolysing)
MCGIAGFSAPEIPVGPWFADATRAASHRGPDGDGCWIRGWEGRRSLQDGCERGEVGTVALGFLRLAILDLAPSGDQPMVAPGRATLCFNGEIYNYVELRRELAALGWSFDSTGDTEVLLKGWLQWGFGVLGRLNGMWAFALYDEQRQGLLLCRDRFGEKPLFWTPWRGGVAFASEVKQLARFPEVELRLNLGRAMSYLTSGRPYDGASSWFSGIHQLEPGTWMWIDADGRRQGRYYDLEKTVLSVDMPRSPAEWAERFGSELRDSVRLRLRSDVPVGTSLSAGVDSSALLVEATRLGHAGYRSFVLGSSDRAVDESAVAEKFAATMGSPCRVVRADGDEFAARWDRLTWHQECPVPSTSVYGQWKVIGEARDNGVIVLLDGQGADEVLGGYHKFYASLVWTAIQARSLGAVPMAIGFARHVGGPRTALHHGHRYIGQFARGPVMPAFCRPSLNHTERAPALSGGQLSIRLADITRWSLPNLLSYVDRNAMSHSVETRLPYLDPGLVALALAMPPDVLIRDGWTKWPLRRALAASGVAGPAWRRGKQWFGAPQAAWLRSSLDESLAAWSRDPHPLWGEIVDVDDLRGLVAQWRVRRPAAAWDDRIFEMLALERFLRTWFAV